LQDGTFWIKDTGIYRPYTLPVTYPTVSMHFDATNNNSNMECNHKF